MISKIAKRAYNEELPVVRKLINMKLFKPLVNQFSPSYKLKQHVRAIQHLQKEYGAAGVSIYKDEAVLEMDNGIKIGFVNEKSVLGIYQERDKGAIEFLLKQLPKKGVFLDIGANIGWYSLHMAKMKQAEVHAFEPVKKIRKLLKRNIELNKLKIQFYPLALSNKKGKIRITNDQFGTNRLVKKTTRSSEIIETSTIDIIAKQLKRVDMIKIDIEGAELLCIQGGEKTLKKYHPELLVEIANKNLVHFNTNASTVFSTLANYGYTCDSVFKGNKRIQIKGRPENYLDVGNNFYFTQQ